MTVVFLEKKDFERKMETRGHLAYKQDQVARLSRKAVPPTPIWASVAASASPSTHAFIYPKNPIF
jgi:hypothetical protein